MMPLLIAYPAVVATVVALDLLWLGVIMKDFYRANLGHLMGDTVVWGAAIAFYFVYAAGIVYFAVSPALPTGSLLKAGIAGLLLGLLCYATYDLTNHATLRQWPLAVTLIDIVWGGVLTAAAAKIGLLVARLFV